MIDYEVKPLVGVGPVLLGMTRAESRHAMMRVPETFKKGADSLNLTDAYHESCFQVFFDAEDRVEYIELSGPSETITARYRGVDAHKTRDETLLALIGKEAAFDPEDPELGHSYVFPALELSVWRPIMPESKKDQEFQYFRTIGVGVKGYFSRR